jgi:hypothetical protein
LTGSGQSGDQAGSSRMTRLYTNGTTTPTGSEAAETVKEAPTVEAGEDEGDGDGSNVLMAVAAGEEATGTSPTSNTVIPM